MLHADLAFKSPASYHEGMRLELHHQTRRYHNEVQQALKEASWDTLSGARLVQSCISQNISSCAHQILGIFQG